MEDKELSTKAKEKQQENLTANEERSNGQS